MQVFNDGSAPEVPSGSGPHELQILSLDELPLGHFIDVHPKFATGFLEGRHAEFQIGVIDRRQEVVQPVGSEAHEHQEQRVVDDLTVSHCVQLHQAPVQVFPVGIILKSLFISQLLISYQHITCRCLRRERFQDGGGPP